MDRKVWSIVIGAVLIACFFLPYMSFAGLFKISAFDIVSGGQVFGERNSSEDTPDKYIMVLTPLAGLILLVGAMMDKSFNRVVLGVLALLGLLYPIIRGVIDSGGEGLTMLFRVMGIGFWLGIIACIALLVYNPKPRIA